MQHGDSRRQSGGGRRVGRALGLLLAALLMACATGWGALALFYLAPGTETFRTGLAWSFAAVGLAGVALLALRRTRRPAMAAFALTFALVLVVWSRARPSNDRVWQPEVAVLPYATFDGDLVTVCGFRPM